MADLKQIMAELKAKNQRKVEPKPQHLVLLKPMAGPIGPAQSLSDILGEILPPKTEFEKAYEIAEAQRLFKPKSNRGPDPRKPWVMKGSCVVEKISEITEGPKTSQEARARVAKGQEKVMLNHIHVKVAQGKRLTKAERKLKGKWDLARIVAGLRPKQSD